MADSPRPGSDAHLREHWVHGPGAITLKWGTPGDFDRCTRALAKYETKGHFDVKGLCAEYHHEATGQWPGAGRDHNSNHAVTAAADGMPPVQPTYQRPDPCPPGSHRMPHGTCMPDPDMTQALAAEPTEPVDTSAQPGEHWRALMHEEGISTGRRTFFPGGLTWRQPPFAFHWEQASSAHNGTPKVVQVGLTTRVLRDGPRLWGYGVLDLDSTDGVEYARRLVTGFARWVSIGPDEHTKPSDITYVYPDGADPATGCEPEEMVIMSGTIAELSGVSTPAQDVAVIEPTDELLAQFDVTTVAATAPPPAPVEPEALTAAAHVIVIDELPPAWWFDEPTDVEMHGAMTVTDRGRVYGLLAPAGVAHRSFHDRAVTVPMGNVDYTRFMGGEALVAGGRRVAGPITMDCGHADPMSRDFAARRQHYDDSCSVVASAAVGERPGKYVWFAGAAMPGLTGDTIAKMGVCRLSGDWQPLAGQPGRKELIAMLLVPVPGFATARARPSVTVDGDGLLVASAVPVEFAPHAEPQRPEADWSQVIGRIAKTIDRDPVTLVAAARARVAGG